MLSPLFLYCTSSKEILHGSVSDLMSQLLVNTENNSVLEILLFETVAVMLLGLFFLTSTDKVLLYYYPIKNLRASIDMYPRLYFSRSYHGQRGVVHSSKCRSSSYSSSHEKKSIANPELILELYKLDASILKYTSVIYRFISAVILSLVIIVLRLTTNSISGLEFNVARTFGPSIND